MKELSAASTASSVMIGISAAISAGILGVSSGAERRSTAIRAAAPRLVLTRLARLPSPPARNSRRREIVAPAAATQVRHASQRVTSATTCSAAASSSTHSGAALQCLGELVAPVGEHEREHDGNRERARGGHRGAAPSLAGHWWLNAIRSLPPWSGAPSVPIG